MASKSCLSSALFFISLFVVFLNVVEFSNAGKTSTFIKKKYSSVDMSLDADVFAPPPNHNAPQQYDTKYYYTLGRGSTCRTFSFVTPSDPGPDVPYTFGLIGDIDQTEGSNRTLTRYEHNPYKGQAVLMVGDLSYADDHPYHNNKRWDSWGRFTERSVAFQPWIWAEGNPEIDFAPELGEKVPFVPYLHGYHVFYKDSGSTSPLWYSIKRASA